MATITGVAFTVGFFAVFWLSEHAHRRRMGAAAEHHEHLEQFNQKQAEQLSVQSLNLTKPYRKLVAIRSPYNLGMLERCLAETDPETTEVVVMTASVLPLGSGDLKPMITDQDRQLLTAVVNLAEHAGKPVKPVIVPTNEPFFAMTRTAKTIGAQELIMGPSNKYRPEDQLDLVALYWLNVCDAKPEPLSIRVLGKDRDVRLDIAGGSQIPKPGAAAAEAAFILAELRKSWHGVERLLLAYDGSPLSADFLDTVVSFLDPAIAITLIDVAEEDAEQDGTDATEEAKQIVERGAERREPWGGTSSGESPAASRPGNRPDRRRGQVRRHLHEPARRVSPRRHDRLRLEYPLRARARTLPRHPGIRPQVDPRLPSRGQTAHMIGPCSPRLPGLLFPRHSSPESRLSTRPHLRGSLSAELGETRNELVPGQHGQAGRLAGGSRPVPGCGRCPGRRSHRSPDSVPGAASERERTGVPRAAPPGSAANRSTNRSSACRDSRTEL